MPGRRGRISLRQVLGLQVPPPGPTLGRTTDRDHIATHLPPHVEMDRAPSARMSVRVMRARDEKRVPATAYPQYFHPLPEEHVSAASARFRRSGQGCEAAAAPLRRQLAAQVVNLDTERVASRCQCTHADPPVLCLLIAPATMERARSRGRCPANRILGTVDGFFVHLTSPRWCGHCKLVRLFLRSGAIRFSRTLDSRDASNGLARLLLERTAPRAGAY